MIEFKDRLLLAANSLNIDLNSQKQELILLYLKQLSKWNKTYNLTSIRDPEQMLIQHIFDSLSVIPIIEEVLYKNTVDRIVDVGSGGGLPGVILAIMDIAEVHCVDTVSKKAAFVQQMASVLSLNNLYAHHSRVENLPSLNANIIISRAFASLYDFVRLSEKHLTNDGCFLAMKGQIPEHEIKQLHENSNYHVIKISELKVPEMDAQRCVLDIRLKES